MSDSQTHDAALAALLSPEELAGHDRRVAALLARNEMLAVLEVAREQVGLTKSELARQAGLDTSAVRRMLTAETANPTTENAFRLCRAMNVSIEAVLPSGERKTIVEGRARTRQAGSRKATAVPASTQAAPQRTRRAPRAAKKTVSPDTEPDLV